MITCTCVIPNSYIDYTVSNFTNNDYNLDEFL